MVSNDPSAQANQDRYINALKALNPGCLMVVMGKYMKKHRQCFSCGATWESFEEKQTDVNIAVHLVADVAGNRADTYMVISADSDIIGSSQLRV